MKVLVSGSTGFVGSAVIGHLKSIGSYGVVRLVRNTRGSEDREIAWNPSRGELDRLGLEGITGVVHLAGENIAGRWNDDKKTRIRESRVKGTRLLSESLAAMEHPPRVMVSVSAIGYYGADRGSEHLDEDSASGEGFLADVCQEWEAATEPARARGIRVVNLRVGLVVDANGGALKMMLPPFRLGAGGVVGSGEQYISWIALEDLLRVIMHCLETESLSGPVNAVTPNPLTNHTFTKTLGAALGRPTFIPVPAAAMRLLFGQMADETLLSSTRVLPKRLEAAHFEWKAPTLETALRRTLNSP